MRENQESIRLLDSSCTMHAAFDDREKLIACWKTGNVLFVNIADISVKND